MALLPSLNRPPAPATKATKTKAKQRYLKAKKNRLKKRVHSATGKTTKSGNTGFGTVEERSDASSSGDESTSDVDDDDEPPPVSAEEVIEKSSKSNRPKKKRKLDLPLDLSTSEGAPEHGELPSSIQDEPSQETIATQSQPPTIDLLPALPRFPLPIQPEAPSASVLYLQGVDQALIEAEVISPSITSPIHTDPAVDKYGLSMKTRQRLAQLGILELFAVQTAILPFLLPPLKSSRSLYLPYNPLRDVCVSAPTGSGKTLAYVLPIIETLSSRLVTRLRALVVLPTRDLVSQVRETFEALCKGRNLKVGAATGQHSFAQEQAQIVGDVTTKLEGGSSKVDILVCTPGRLMDHLTGTSNFTLQHLRYLVIDEADRLVTEAFQDWLAQVMAATRPPMNSTLPSSHTQTLQSAFSIPHPDSLHPAWINSSSFGIINSDLSERKHSSCQKLLFSATLTRDPSKIAALNLNDPKYFVVGTGAVSLTENENGTVGESFAFPSTLKEHLLICDTSQKPLMLLYLMHTKSVKNALVFTRSAESTARLVKLIQAFEQSFSSSMATDDPSSNVLIDTNSIVAEAYSSDLTASQRKTILEKFKNAEIGILVCSDLISRGIDISHVSHVVSYDAPVDMRKYVHRVGRTARAGRNGDAWSLVEEQEARYFKKMMSETGHLDSLTKVKVATKALEPFMAHYEHALDQLKAAYGR